MVYGSGYATLGIGVGTYDSNPARIVTELIVWTFSIAKYYEINENSKLILKVNGENIHRKR